MKIATIMILTLITILVFLNNLIARPVSYSGGWTMMSYNDYFRNTLLTHFSPSSKYSIGYMTQYWQNQEYWINALNLNFLAKRINK